MTLPVSAFFSKVSLKKGSGHPDPTDDHNKPVEADSGRGQKQYCVVYQRFSASRLARHEVWVWLLPG